MDDGIHKIKLIFLEHGDVKTDYTSVDLQLNEQSITSESVNLYIDLGMNDSEMKDDSP